MPQPTLLEPGNLIKVIPIDYLTEWVQSHQMFKSNSDRVIILKSETGSGKSTVLPAHMMQLYYKGNSTYHGKSVLCTQPRVLTAQALAHSIINSPHYSTLTSSLVGYMTGPASQRPPAGLIYATVQILMFQILKPEELINLYNIIIIDEAHASLIILISFIKDFLTKYKGEDKIPFLYLQVQQ